MRKSVIFILSAFFGAVLGAGIVGKNMFEKYNKMEAMSNKHYVLFRMMNQWVRIKQENKKLDNYLKELGYSKIAIYGMSDAGKALIDELDGSDSNVLYGIDRNSELTYKNIIVISPDDVLKPVDVVIVTAITYFDEIQKKLSEKIECPIISLEDILYEI